MAIIATAPIPVQTLLSTLKSIRTSCETRALLLNELDSNYDSFLSQLPSTLDISPRPSAANTTTATDGVTSCQTEAVRPPNEAEMGEILRISLIGLMEVRDEISASTEVIRACSRSDLVTAIEIMEQKEQERLKITIERDVLLRLQALEDGDFDSAIVDANTKRAQLSEEIAEAFDEIRSEIAELAAEES